MIKKQWGLKDVQQVASQSDGALAAPEPKLLEPLEKGHRVKLVFVEENDSGKEAVTETLWVEILLVSGSQLMGQLEDDPRRILGLHRGEMIEFDERHILETD